MIKELVEIEGQLKIEEIRMNRFQFTFMFLAIIS